MTIQAAIAPVAPTTAVTSTKTKKEREQLLADIQAALAPYGVRTEITPYSNRHFLADFITPQIRANIDLDADDAEPSMIHWYRATANLKAVPGTFDEADINASPRRKATSFPPTFNLLISAFVAGFSASPQTTEEQRYGKECCK